VLTEDGDVNAIAAARGIYSVTDAARLTGVSPRRIRGWLQGWRQKKGKPAAGPVLRPEHELRDGELALGFLDLLEVAFLGKLVQAAERRGRSLSWKAIRTAAETARRKFGTDHPFALRRIHTDGRAILLEAQKETGDRALYDLVADNFAIYDVLADSFIASVEYEGDEPRRWTPDERFPRIIVDPRRAFGRPIETQSGTPAEALFDAWRAEHRNAAKVAAFFGTDREGVAQAVRFTLEGGAPIALAA
jgi:uncharacterized protein (DUF433 family)